MLQQIIQSLAETPIESSPQADAAVLLPIFADTDLNLLLTVRAKHLNSHAGEVAFPGGKVDTTDQSIIETALRETHEEVGIAAEYIEILGQLSKRKSRFGLAVQPYVGLVKENATITASKNELDSTFKVPLDFFKATRPYPTTRFKGQVIPVISYEYDGHIIWGLTARIIQDLVNTAFAPTSLIEK